MGFLILSTKGAKRLGDYFGVCSRESGLNAVSRWTSDRPHSAAGEEWRHESSQISFLEGVALDLGPLGDAR